MNSDDDNFEDLPAGELEEEELSEEEESEEEAPTKKN